MTLKELLETGYGIDFSTLDFKLQEGYEGTKEDVLKSLENNEVLITASLGGATFEVEDYDIEDTPGVTTLYLG